MAQDVSNFVQDLLSMAKAQESLPKVQTENAELTKQVENYAQTVQDRELRIIDLNKKIEEVQAKLRQTEEERDQAIFQNATLEERINKASKFFSSLTGELVGISNEVDPRPMPEPEPVVEQPKVDTPQIELEPVVAQAEPVTVLHNQTTEAVEVPPTPFVQTSIVETSQESSPVPAQSSTASEPSGATTPLSAEPTDTQGPYANINYEDYPRYVSPENWVKGGGTMEAYHFRRSRVG